MPLRRRNNAIWFLCRRLEPLPLDKALQQWDAKRRLIFCDETTPIASPAQALASVAPPAAVLVGPEGGFTDEERAMLKNLPFVTAISLGPRIMRADTVAIAALALVQAVIGDWHHKS
jgi:16S rRNA (uracil1498-N3)-methyltransferase